MTALFFILKFRPLKCQDWFLGWYIVINLLKASNFLFLAGSNWTFGETQKVLYLNLFFLKKKRKILSTLTFCWVFCNLSYVFCEWHLYYRSYQRRDLLNRVYASDEVRIYAIHRADQIQSSLGADFPSFVKPMLQSHVTGGFWLVRVNGLSN